jgi:hypothetical protein
VTGEIRQRPVWRELVHEVGVGDVEVALRVDRDCVGMVQLRVQGRAAQFAVGEHGPVAAAGDGPDLPVRRDLANELVRAVGDVDVSGLVHGNVARLIEQRLGRRAARRPRTRRRPNLY